MTRRFFFHPLPHIAAILGTLVLLCAATPAFAKDGDGGYQYCFANYPQSTGWVPGLPIYLSAVYHYPGGSYNGSALVQYIKQHYGVTNGLPFSCSSGGLQGPVQDSYSNFVARLKADGHKFVETGFVLSGAAANPATPAGQVQSATAPPAVKSPHFFCTVGAGSKVYVSAVMPDVDPRINAIRAFQKYVKEQSHSSAPVPLPSCSTHDTEAAANQMFHQWVLTEGPKLVQTGWTYNGQSAESPAPAAPPPVAAAPSPSYAPAPAASAASAAPATGNVVVRLVDPVNTFTDKPGKQYRAVVTQAVTIGHVSIPVNTLATVTVAGSANNLTAQLSSLSLNGQPLTVSTTSVTASTAAANAAVSAAEAGAKQVQSIMSLGSFGGFKKKPAVPNAVTTMAQGDHVVLPPGTTLTFTTDVPQNSAPQPAPAGGSPTASAAPASTGNDEVASAFPGAYSASAVTQQTGAIGPNGVTISGSESGVPKPYYCYFDTIPPGAHRETIYYSAPFTTAQAQLWTMFWWSKYIHSTYHIPGMYQNANAQCDQLKPSPAEQQAAVSKTVTRWKQHNDDTVHVNWMPTDTAAPGTLPPWGEIQQGNFEAPGSQPSAHAAPMTAGAAPTVCVVTFQARTGNHGKTYLSQVFDSSPFDAHAKEMHVFQAGTSAFMNYTRGLMDISTWNLVNAECRAYPTQASAQQTLTTWMKSNNDVHQSIPTNWVYNASMASQMPPPGNAQAGASK